MAIDLKDKKKVKKYMDRLYHVLNNNGLIYNDGFSEEKLTVQDLVTTTDIAPFIPKVIRRIIIEAIQPNLLVIPNLFTKLNIPEGQIVEIGNIGGIMAGKVSQGGTYPRSTLSADTTGTGVSIKVAKYGCAINIAREVLEDNQFDVINIWLRAAGAALARLKENKAIKLINTMGTTVFDNASPGTSEYGTLTGRNIAGAANGTMTINDLFDMWAYLALRGFNPDTLIMNPLAWKTFAVDPELREIVIRGAVLATKRMPIGSGNPGWADPFSPEGVGARYKYTGDENGIDAFTQTLTPVNATWNVPPQYLPSPMKVLVTHLAPYTDRGMSQKPITNIIMADSQRCGILVQREDVNTEEDNIFEREVRQIHIRERYGMGVFDQGKGIAVSRSVVVDRNYIFDNVNTATLSEVDVTTAKVS